MNTFSVSLLNECESIISCVEDVIHSTETNDFVTNLLQVEEFENIRTIAEELNTLVEYYENDYFSVTSEEFDAISITLYQSVKYCLEALEESITDTEILTQFEYIRIATNTIRDILTK